MKTSVSRAHDQSLTDVFDPECFVGRIHVKVKHQKELAERGSVS